MDSTTIAFSLKCYQEFRKDKKNFLISDFIYMYKYIGKNIALNVWIRELISDLDLQSPYSDSLVQANIPASSQGWK